MSAPSEVHIVESSQVACTIFARVLTISGLARTGGTMRLVRNAVLIAVVPVVSSWDQLPTQVTA